jgi:hypothetical protein
MAKQLSMEDLVKKYKYLQKSKGTNPLTSRAETSKNPSADHEHIFDDEFLKYSSKTQSIASVIASHSSLAETSSWSSGGAGASHRSLSAMPPETSTASNSEDACKVCLDAEANCAFIDCGHIATCLTCAKLLTKCPICRETIKRTLRIYKS